MIIKIGVDVVSVERIREAMEREGFVERVLTNQEIYAPVTAEFLAGRWAAKEAIVKCLGGKISDYTIMRDDGGAPYLATEIGEGLHLHLSISHERETAVAVAVLEKD